MKTRLCGDAFLLTPRFICGIAPLGLATENRGTARGASSGGTSGPPAAAENLSRPG